MFEGHDTTAANMAWTLHLLAKNPDIQKRAQEELDEIFESDPKRGATAEDLANMKYLERCIKEGLRLYPSVPLMSRTLHEEATVEGKTVPAGTNVILMNYILHRDPKHFPDPEKFDPDRFLPENSRGRHPYSYVPFSAGPRNCIGQKFASMEEKIVISSVLRNFDMTTTTNNVTAIPELILRPKNGVPIKLTPREKIRS